METKAEAYRLKPDTKARIAEMAEASHRTKTDVVRLAVDTLYAKHIEAVREGQ
jgi:predicted transcriptional regulator